MKIKQIICNTTIQKEVGGDDINCNTPHTKAPNVTISLPSLQDQFVLCVCLSMIHCETGFVCVVVLHYCRLGK